MSNFNKLMERLGYQFNNLRLLSIALTHRSSGPNNNERLEFLGDSILGFIIASELYRQHPEVREGDLSRMRASMVNGDVLTKLSTNLGVNEYLYLSVGEKKSGGKRCCSILADALEAIIGAIYIDGGLESCRQCILSWYCEYIDNLSKFTFKKDAKSLLQEWLQARKLPLPIYKMRVTGEPHAQTFRISCYVEGLLQKTEGINTTRRRAEQIAAKRFLELL